MEEKKGETPLTLGVLVRYAYMIACNNYYEGETKAIPDLKESLNETKKMVAFFRNILGWKGLDDKVLYSNAEA